MKSSKQKLIITVTTANAWIYPEAKNYPKTPEETSDIIFKCYKEGASIAHVHLTKKAEKKNCKINS